MTRREALELLLELDLRYVAEDTDAMRAATGRACKAMLDKAQRNGTVTVYAPRLDLKGPWVTIGYAYRNHYTVAVSGHSPYWS